MLKIGRLIIVSQTELNDPGNDLRADFAGAIGDAINRVTPDIAEQLQSAIAAGIEVALAPLHAQVAALRPMPELDEADAPAAADALEPIVRQLAAACQAADAYLHQWPGPLPPEARPICAQIVDAVGAAQLALREAPNA